MNLLKLFTNEARTLLVPVPLLAPLATAARRFVPQILLQLKVTKFREEEAHHITHGCEYLT